MSEEIAIAGDVRVGMTSEELTIARDDKKNLTAKQLQAIGSRAVDSAGIVEYVGYLNQPRKEYVEVQDEDGKVVEKKFKRIELEIVKTRDGHEIPAMGRCVLRTLHGFNVSWRSFRTRQSALFVVNLVVAQSDAEDTRERLLVIIRTSANSSMEGPSLTYKDREGNTKQRRVPSVDLAFINHIGCMAVDHHLPERSQ